MCRSTTLVLVPSQQAGNEPWKVNGHAIIYIESSCHFAVGPKSIQLVVVVVLCR